MTVMVDEVRVWPHAKEPFDKGSCHLMVENHYARGAITELHAFAKRIGLKLAWFQGDTWAPHYDLTPARREAALAAGAVFVPAKQQARDRRAARLAHEMTRLMTGPLATVVTDDALP